MKYHTLLIRQADGTWQADDSGWFHSRLVRRAAAYRARGFPYSSILERWQWQIITTDGRRDTIVHRIRILNRYFAPTIALIAAANNKRRAALNRQIDDEINAELRAAGIDVSADE